MRLAQMQVGLRHCFPVATVMKRDYTSRSSASCHLSILGRRLDDGLMMLYHDDAYSAAATALRDIGIDIAQRLPLRLDDGHRQPPGMQ